MFSGLRNRMFQPVDDASLVFFRIFFGFLMMVEVWRFLANGWLERYYLRREFLFPFTGFEWIQPWPGDGLYIHFYVLGLAGLGIMLGFCYRLCATIFFLGFTYVFLLCQTRYLNHLYLVCLFAFLLIWISPHRTLSLDAKLWPKRAAKAVPIWQLWLLQAQLGFVYFFGGVAKINRDWLAGKPLDDWLSDKDGIPILDLLLGHDWSPLFFSWSGLFIDLFAVPLLLWRRTRLWMFITLVMFHFMNLQLFDIGIFPWMATGATTLFLNPSWPRRIFNWPPLRENLAVGTGHRRLVLICLGAFVFIQTYLPLRHHLFRGNVNWTEEGHYFSWRMKLRDKDGGVRFILEDPDRDITYYVRPSKHLSKRQIRKMEVRPHMIHRFAKYLAEKAKEAGQERVIVRAEAPVSLNGRRDQLIVDPEVDLAAEPYRPFGKSPWITKLER